jgi:hypothetical protein
MEEMCSNKKTKKIIACVKLNRWSGKWDGMVATNGQELNL